MTDESGLPSDVDAAGDDKATEGLLLCLCRGDGELPPAGVPGASAVSVRRASLTAPSVELLEGMSDLVRVCAEQAVRQNAVLASDPNWLSSASGTVTKASDMRGATSLCDLGSLQQGRL